MYGLCVGTVLYGYPALVELGVMVETDAGWAAAWSGAAATAGRLIARVTSTSIMTVH